MTYPQTIAEARKVLGLDPDGPATISVSVAGRIAYGTSHNRSYELAKTGDLPVTNIGGRLRVSVIALARKVLTAGDDTPDAPAAA